MYRCTDCGQEFEIKPDYCDCGNDKFVEDEPAVASVSTSIPAKEKVIIPRKSPNRIDIPSLLIFLTCIILSILSLIFIGRETTNLKQTSENTSTVKEDINIPSIDKLWKEPQSVQVQVKPDAVVLPATPKEVVVQPKPLVKKVEQKKNTPSQPVVNPKPVQPQVSPVVEQKQPSMTEAQKQAIIDKLTKNNKPQKVEPAKVTPPAQETKSTVAEVKPQETTPPPVKIDYAAQKKELNAYKVALRNKIGGNINFAAVIGDGKCAITFKIDDVGNLTNRTFSVQSTNDSLNDAVYAAMIQNPTFKAPPEGYNNETLTLSVKIYGGNFEVSLK